MEANSIAATPRPLVDFVSASQIAADAEKARQIAENEAKAAQLAATPSLLSYVENCRLEAIQAKMTTGVTDRLLDAQRRRKGENSPQRKAQLKTYGLPDYWVPLTQTKCIHTEAWLRDLLMPYADKIWLLEPTVLPELPDNRAEEIRRALTIEALELMANKEPLTEEQTREAHDDAMDEAERQVMEEAKERVKRMERLIQDQQEECDFRATFREVQENLTTYGTAFIKGPFTTVKKMPKWINGKRTVVKTIIPTCSAPSPHDIFPAPWAKDENDGYMIERIKTYRQGLCDVKELEYYRTAEIDALLMEKDATNRTAQYGDQTRENQEDKPSTPVDNRIEIWSYIGPISGYMLKDWGIENVQDTEEYAMEVQWSGTHIIKVMPRWDEVGASGYFRCVFKSQVGSFWGIGVPLLMSASQDRANSVMVSLVDNLAFGSGPNGWVDLNAIVNPDDVKAFHARKIVPFRRKPGDNGVPMGFFDIPLRTAELSAVYKDCQNDADNESGVPAYMYGSGASGPAAGTYSGLQTLMNASARGIKDALLSVGTMVSRFVQHWADWNNEYAEDDAVKGDVRVLCTAGVGLFVQELQLSNLDNLINQAVSLAAILGPRGYSFIVGLLREKAKILKIDVRGLPTEEELAEMAQGLLQQQSSAESPGNSTQNLLPADTQPGARPEAPEPLAPLPAPTGVTGQ